MPMEASSHPARLSSDVAAPTSDPVGVVVLANVRLYRDGLVLVLSGHAGLRVIGQGPADRDGMSVVCSLAPDVVLLEAPAAYGTSLVKDLASRLPATRVVAYGVSGDDVEMMRCVEAGVAGYVPTNATSNELVATALSAARGEFACSPRLAALLLRRVQDLAAEHRSTENEVLLTPREQQIGELIDDGLSNKEIAARLGIEVSTVKNHVHKILDKLHAKHRLQAAAHIRRARI